MGNVLAKIVGGLQIMLQCVQETRELPLFLFIDQSYGISTVTEHPYPGAVMMSTIPLNRFASA